MDALGLSTFAVVALSLGGRVAIQYAGTHVNRVSRLVVVDIGPDIAPEGMARVGRMMAGAPERFDTLEEDILSVEIAKAMVDVQPRTRYVEVAGAGHTVPGDQPEAFTALLREFLEA